MKTKKKKKKKISGSRTLIIFSRPPQRDLLGGPDEVMCGPNGAHGP